MSRWWLSNVLASNVLDRLDRSNINFLEKTEQTMKRALFCNILLCVFLISVSNVSADEDWGHFEGQIIVKGIAPENPPESVKGPDAKLCLVDGKIPLDDGFVISKKNELANVYVFMFEGRGANKPKAYHPNYDKLKAAVLVLDNVKCRFLPKALFVRSGQDVKFKNSDAAGHNCNIKSFEHARNFAIPANQSVDVTFGMGSDKTPATLVCDMHTWMDSVIFIRDNPYVAITDSNGKFKIENLPPGDWQFQFWHQKAGYLKEIEIKGYKVSRKGVIEATIKAGETLDLGKLDFPAEAF